MKQVLHIFLCVMISLVQAEEDPLLQEDGTLTSHQESRQLKAPAGLKPVYPYIDEKCCNLTTTSVCSRFGSDGFKGHCTPRNETCLGREFFGSRYCLISNLASCKCCVPTDCKRHTLAPCAALNGTCIGLNDHCDGKSVVSEEFCKKDSKRDTCKCCFPPDDCPCGQDYRGQCRGSLPNGEAGEGHCMKTCDPGRVSLKDNTCNATGGRDCKCCDKGDYCGATCETPNPMSCMCVINGNQCPKGYCSHPNAYLCPHEGCTCCKEKPSDCVSKLDQCSAPNYCVDKLSGDCPRGFSKVYDACITWDVGTLRGDGEISKQKDCDCCKVDVCSSIHDRCTGKGSFCTDIGKCPNGYTQSHDCSKPLMQNGTIVGIKMCLCCKPKSSDCPEGCFRVGSQCFRRHPQPVKSWEYAAKICSGYKYSTLAEPQNLQALSQYLDTNYDDESYWIGAHCTGNYIASWVSGGLIGPNAPWFINGWEKCINSLWCIHLQADSGCYVSNQCLRCTKCYTYSYGKPRTPLCTCQTIRE